MHVLYTPLIVLLQYAYLVSGPLYKKHSVSCTYPSVASQYSWRGLAGSDTSMVWRPEKRSGPKLVLCCKKQSKTRWYFTSSANSIATLKSRSDDVDSVVFGIGSDVVSLTEVVKVSGVGELSCRVSLETSQLGQVEHLHAVTESFRYNKSVIVHDFHVTPRRCCRPKWISSHLFRES